MKYKEYQQQAERTDAPMGKEYDNLHAIHMVMGMATEVMELQDVFKKSLAYKKPIDWVNVKEELGDLMWYVANFCRENNIDLEEVMNTNIKKLSARYPDKFDTKKANNRNLDKERSILDNTYYEQNYNPK